jgi:curli biogenesis system outer membrane secretion channel CsgG
MTRFISVCMTFGLLLPTPAVAQESAPKPAVAFGGVEVRPGGWTLPPPELSASIGGLLMDDLVSSGVFHIVDAQWLVPESEIGHEPNLDRLRAGAASSGVDYLVIGAVTAFSAESRTRRGFGVAPFPLIGGGMRRHTQLAVALMFKVVGVRTGEIVTTATAEGTASRRATALGGLGVFHGLPIGGIWSSGNGQLPRDAMLAEAVRSAVHTVAAALQNAAARLPRRASDSR